MPLGSVNALARFFASKAEIGRNAIFWHGVRLNSQPNRPICRTPAMVLQKQPLHAMTGLPGGHSWVTPGNGTNHIGILRTFDSAEHRSTPDPDGVRNSGAVPSISISGVVFLSMW